jgi:hypothetical protein
LRGSLESDSSSIPQPEEFDRLGCTPIHTACMNRKINQSLDDLDLVYMLNLCPEAAITRTRRQHSTAVLGMPIWRVIRYNILPIGAFDSWTLLMDRLCTSHRLIFVACLPQRCRQRNEIDYIYFLILKGS